MTRYRRPLKIALFILWFSCIALSDQLDATLPAFKPIRVCIVGSLPLLYIILLIRDHRIKNGKPVMPP